MKGPLLCAVLVAVVYYPKLVVMNTILSLCVSGYHRYHLLYVDIYTVLYIGYLVRCVGQRFGMFPCCILVLVIVSGVLTCYDVRQVAVVFSEGGLCI